MWNECVCKGKKTSLEQQQCLPLGHKNLCLHCIIFPLLISIDWVNFKLLNGKSCDMRAGAKKVLSSYMTWFPKPSANFPFVWHVIKQTDFKDPVLYLSLDIFTNCFHACIPFSTLVTCSVPKWAERCSRGCVIGSLAIRSIHGQEVMYEWDLFAIHLLGPGGVFHQGK